MFKSQWDGGEDQEASVEAVLLGVYRLREETSPSSAPDTARSGVAGWVAAASQWLWSTVFGSDGRAASASESALSQPAGPVTAPGAVSAAVAGRLEAGGVDARRKEAEVSTQFADARFRNAQRGRVSEEEALRELESALDALHLDGAMPQLMVDDEGRLVLVLGQPSLPGRLGRVPSLESDSRSNESS